MRPNSSNALASPLVAKTRPAAAAREKIMLFIDTTPWKGNKVGGLGISFSYATVSSPWRSFFRLPSLFPTLPPGGVLTPGQEMTRVAAGWVGGRHGDKVTRRRRKSCLLVGRAAVGRHVEGQEIGHRLVAQGVEDRTPGREGVCHPL